VSEIPPRGLAHIEGTSELNIEENAAIFKKTPP
jgi:hypothetical protein